jgi:hypothetical protein
VPVAGPVGVPSRLVAQRAGVDYLVIWMEQHRPWLDAQFAQLGDQGADRGWSGRAGDHLVLHGASLASHQVQVSSVSRDSGKHQLRPTRQASPEPAHESSSWLVEFPYWFKAGPAGGRLRRPSSRRLDRLDRLDRLICP